MILSVSNCKESPKKSLFFISFYSIIFQFIIQWVPGKIVHRIHPSIWSTILPGTHHRRVSYTHTVCVNVSVVYTETGL